MPSPIKVSTGAPAQPLLRELDEQAFFERYACDRYTASIIANRFQYIMKHMATKLRACAFSPVLRDMDDFCTTISGPPEIGWPMPATSLTNPGHWGPIADSVPIVLQDYGLAELEPGDVIAANDSYRTGKHLNDMSFIRPLFWEGRLIGAAHITAHQIDLGSRAPGGFLVTAQSLWEDGLVLTPMALFKAGEPVRSTFNLIAANTRYPDAILADLLTLRSSLDLGEELLMQTIGRYGLDAYIGAVRYSTDAAEETLRRAIEALPDGDYYGEGVVDGDGLPDSPEYVVRVTIAKRGGRMEFDFSGTSAASPTAVGCSWLDVKTGILIALKMLLDRSSLPNSGGMRNIDIVLPPGSILNPYPPAATMFYFVMTQAIITATMDALNPAMGEDAVAGDSGANTLHRGHGKTISGAPWQIPAIHMSRIQGGGAWGATKAGDADCFSLVSWTNYPQTGYEIVELDTEVLAMRSEVAIDTGGVGYNRGGPGHVVDAYWMHGGYHHCYTTLLKAPPHGAFGGGSGRTGAAWLFDAETTGHARKSWLPADLHGSLYSGSIAMCGAVNPDTRELDPNGEFMVMGEEVFCTHGATARYVTNGGGGWGRAFDREPERVLRDVRDGYVSLAGAKPDYGVAVLGDPERDPEGLKVDEAATAALRTAASLG